MLQEAEKESSLIISMVNKKSLKRDVAKTTFVTQSTKLKKKKNGLPVGSYNTTWKSKCQRQLEKRVDAQTDFPVVMHVS